MPKKIRQSRPLAAISSRWQAYGLMLINTVCWGAAFVVVKPAFEVTTPFRYLFYRFVLASILSIPFIVYYWRKIKHPAKYLLRIFLLELLGTTLALALVYEGLARTSVIGASILTALGPTFVTVSGVILLREKMERNEWFGSGVALFATLGLVLHPMIFGIERLGRISMWGEVLILGHLVANGIYMPLAKKYYAELPKLFATSISFIVGALSFGILSVFEAKDFQVWQTAIQTDLGSTAVVMAFGYMATFGSIIALTAYIKGQDLIEASEASFFTYLGLPFTLLLAHAALGENLQWYQFWCLILITLGVIVAEKRFSRRRKKVALA